MIVYQDPAYMSMNALKFDEEPDCTIDCQDNEEALKEMVVQLNAIDMQL